MKNYTSRINIGNNKYAYVQDERFAKKADFYLSRISQYWTCPDYYFHLNSGGHVAGVKKHIYSKYFSKFDIERFYFHVTKNKILRSLKKIGMPFSIADQIASESVVLADGKFSLPYGFVQSPILASIVLQQSALGRFIGTLAQSFPLTVYMDDVIVSHRNDDQSLFELSQKVIRIAELSRLPINPNKVTVAKSEIQVFNICLAYKRASITNQRMADFCVQLQNCIKKEQVDGILRYVLSVNADQYRDLRTYCINRGIECS